MKFVTSTPEGIVSDANQVIEIKIWETYLLHTRTNVPFLLNQFSLDHGPVENVLHEPGRIIYRFAAATWESTVRNALYENRIPVVVKSARTVTSHLSRVALYA